MTRTKIGFGLATVTALVALFACSSGSTSTGGEASCFDSLIGSSCYSCAQSHCESQVNTVYSACSDFIGCACPGGSLSCSAAASVTCSEKATESSCGSARQDLGACTQQNCASQCDNYLPCGADAGGGSSVSCAGSAMADACPMAFCTATSNAVSSCYYEVGSQKFACTSCSDTTSCEQAAMAACK